MYHDFVPAAFANVIPYKGLAVGSIWISYAAFTGDYQILLAFDILTVTT
jgi:hypothetical protein